MKVNLIASSPHFFEMNWIRELLNHSDIDLTEHVSPNLSLFLDDSLYILSADHNRFDQLPQSFFSALRKIKSKGLLHISDELFRGQYMMYGEFDFVIRQYHSRYFTNS